MNLNSSQILLQSWYLPSSTTTIVIWCQLFISVLILARFLVILVILCLVEVVFLIYLILLFEEVGKREFMVLEGLIIPTLMILKVLIVNKKMKLSYYTFICFFSDFHFYYIWVEAYYSSWQAMISDYSSTW